MIKCYVFKYTISLLLLFLIIYSLRLILTAFVAFKFFLKLNDQYDSGEALKKEKHQKALVSSTLLFFHLAHAQAANISLSSWHLHHLAHITAVLSGGFE